jgi:protein-disulfide isomerase
MESTEKPRTFMLSTPLAILISGIVIALAIVYVGGEGKSLPTETLPLEKPLVAVRQVTSEDHVMGSREAEITLVEYSDFECPFCAQIHATLEAIVKDSNGKVAWAYRHFPLTMIHREALPSALAAECVAKLGGGEAFWKFGTTLFEQQQMLGSEFYTVQAERLGISRESFSACMEEKTVEPRIRADFEEAIAAGGQGTPFIIIQRKDGVSAAFSGALSREAIEQLIDGVRKQ